MWCTVKLVEEQERLRAGLIQSILAYVRMASFLTYRGTDGFVRYAMWFGDRHLGYILGLHAVNPKLGGIEIRPVQQPAILEGCSIVWDMEMARYGGDPLPGDTGMRSATAALGTQITDAAFRLLVCRRVDHSAVMAEWEKSGGKPVSIYRKVAGMAAREATDFLSTSGKPAARTVRVRPKNPPYTHVRILLGGNNNDHLAILQDSFPAGSLRRRGMVKPGDVPALVTTPPKVTHGNMVHFPVFNDEELSMLEIIPGKVTEVPMKYGRPIVTTSQPPTRFADLIHQPDESSEVEPVPIFLRSGAGGPDPLDCVPGDKPSGADGVCSRVPDTNDIGGTVIPNTDDRRAVESGLTLTSFDHNRLFMRHSQSRSTASMCCWRKRSLIKRSLAM